MMIIDLQHPCSYTVAPLSSFLFDSAWLVGHGCPVQSYFDSQPAQQANICPSAIVFGILPKVHLYVLSAIQTW